MAFTYVQPAINAQPDEAEKPSFNDSEAAFTSRAALKRGRTVIQDAQHSVKFIVH